MVMECDLTESNGIDQARTAAWIRMFLAYSKIHVDRQPHDLKVCRE